MSRWLIGTLMMTLACTAMGQSWPNEHPRLRLADGDETTWKRMIRDYRIKDDAALHAMFVEEGRDFAKNRNRYEDAIIGAVQLWRATDDEQYRGFAIRFCRAALGEWIDADDGALRGAINELGGRDETNFLARDACWHFALLYHLTGDRDCANKAEVLLARFAEVIPDWKIYWPHHGEQRFENVCDQDWPRMRDHWDMAGFWGIWLHGNILGGVPLARAYDLIYDSGFMQQRGSLEAIEHMLQVHLDLQYRYGRRMFNMDGTAMRGIMQFAYYLGRPQYTHDVEDWVSDMYKALFYADGWWSEGSPSYFKQIHHSLQTVVKSWLIGYSDPPGFVANDGTRFDDYQPGLAFQRAIDRADAALAAAVQPDYRPQIVHDTTSSQQAWWTDRMTEARSYLFGRVGHVILGTGKGDDMVQATLHFGGAHGHEHYDTLNLILFAKGKELLSETRYRPLPESQSTRDWHMATAGHLTVVIDGRDQIGRFGAGRVPGVQVREKQPTDAIDGVDDWYYRWRGYGNNMNDGRLRLHNTTFDMVQVVEADGERSYVPMPDQYRRTIALVKIDEHDTYVVDIFRVRGGETHDYMLHGCLDHPYAMRTSLSLDEPVSGTLHEYIRDLHTARTDEAWTVDMPLDDGSAATKTWFGPQRGVQLIQGVAPSMRRVDDAPFLAVRHEGGQSIFVAVHHPYIDRPRVHAVEFVAMTPGGVTLKVEHDAGIDTIESTNDGLTHRRDGAWHFQVGGEQEYRGTLIESRRIEAGDNCDAFVTLRALPTDGSLDGHTLMVNVGGKLVHGLLIDHIERDGDRTIIHSRGEPGMTIHRSLVKLEYFPGWGIAGRATFRIAGSRLELSE